MRHFEARCLAAVLLLLARAELAAGQGDRWVGKQVVTKSADVRPRIGKQAVEAGRLFRVYRVELVRGEWLWVVSGEVRGWISVREAIPYDRALEVCTEEIRSHPKAAAYLLRGNLWLDKAQYENAITDFTEAIRLAPQAPDAYARRADARMARTESSIKAFEKRSGSHAILNRDEPDLVALERLTREESDLILDDYQKALRIEPGNARAFLNSGVAWLYKGQPDRALGCLDEAIRLDPKSSSAYLARSRAWYASDHQAKALADLDTALRLDPRNIDALEERVQADDFTGQYDRLIADASALLKLDPENAHAYILRGNAWSTKKQDARARDDYEAALRIDPGNEIAEINLRGVMKDKSASGR